MKRDECQTPQLFRHPVLCYHHNAWAIWRA
jgi:hypothetical protein